MKTLLLCGLCLFGAIWLPGCASTPRTTEAIVFDTFQSTFNTAKAAYMAYQELVVSGQVGPEKMRKADLAWNEFRARFTLAVRLANNDWTAATPEAVQKLSNDFIALIRSL